MARDPDDYELSDAAPAREPLLERMTYMEKSVRDLASRLEVVQKTLARLSQEVGI